MMAFTRSEINRRYRERHPDRVREQRRRQASKQREYERRYRLALRYGITVEDFSQMLTEQGGCCALCRTDTPGGRGDWHVDHDHDTGRVRGLLCARCNLGLGMLEHVIRYEGKRLQRFLGHKAA